MVHSDTNSEVIRAKVEQFIIHELDLLDVRNFEHWMDLFADDGCYWAPTTIDQVSPAKQVSIFYDDKDLMRKRITRLRHERIHSQIPHSRTVHMLSGLQVVSSGQSNAREAPIVTRANFLMVEYRPSVPEGIQRVFSGRYEHHLRPFNDSFKIAMKKATLVNCDSVFSPLAIYF
ncbi:aromatic-ring-hydroxylating dioxygenase subunit beta [Burkholderia multivorans]|uniref:aromatic-ring-hydroxylating dioxygenase subunit beta n=1 Tax=Burkholderia multivorans TaxID=87883 RepID=UPI00158AB926|nr:aromatic-ring-hydroxylating dioxygenase subunit beta [Burkholderia multivorans]